MKNQIYPCVCLVLLLAVSFASWDKETSYNGDVTVAVDYQDHAVPGAKVYYNKGAVINKGITADQYSGMQTTDANGATVFNNLAPGSYYFYATRFSAAVNRAVRGDTSMAIHVRYRDKRIINTK